VLRFQDAVGLRALLRRPALRVTLLALLTVDLLLIGLHAAHVWAEWQRLDLRVADLRFSLETEGGPSGHWETAKTALCVLALADCGRCAGQPVYAALALAFGIALDLLHAAIGGLRRAVDRGIGTVEDGGELLLLSFAAAFAVGLSRRLAGSAALRCG
jgi:hypothetical protein